jgi:hypothetical protein
MYSVSAHCDGLQFLQSGFSSPEAQHVWIDGLTGKLEFMMPSGNTNAQLSIVVVGRSEQQQLCTVVANGKVIVSDAEVRQGETEIIAPLPAVAGAVLGKMRVTLTIAHASPVRNKEGKVVDPRYLGMQLVALTVFDKPRAAPVKRGRIQTAIAWRLRKAATLLSGPR